MGQDPGTFLENKHLLVMLRHVARRTDRGKPCLDQCCWSPREIIFIRCWLSTPIFLPEKPHGQRSLVGSLCPWDHKKSNVTERLSTCTHTHPLHTLFKDVAYICNHCNIPTIWVLSPPSSCLICRQQSRGTESLITFSKVNQLLGRNGTDTPAQWFWDSWISDRKLTKRFWVPGLHEARRQGPKCHRSERLDSRYD